MAEYTEAIYPGALDYLTPSYSNLGSSETIGYNVPVSELAGTLDPRTANQLGEINRIINTGATNIEVQGLMAKNWEAVPKQHLKEINRLAKLTGVKPSLHAPLIEPSGVGERGWSEMDRESAEKQLASAILRGHELDPDGNVIITVHSTAQLPEMVPTIKTKENGKEVEKIKTLWVVNPDTGKIGAIETQKRYFPEEGEKFTGEEREFNPHKELTKLNQDAWLDQLSGVNRYVSFGEETLDQLNRAIRGPPGEERLKPEQAEQILIEIAGIKTEEGIPPELEKVGVKENFEEIQKGIEHSQVYLRGAYKDMKQLFDNIYARADEKDKAKLKEYADWAVPRLKEGIDRDPTKVREFAEIVSKGLKTLGKIENPQTYIPLNDFVIEKSAQTFGNIAASAYEQFKDKAPIISIENPPAGQQGLSKAEDLKNLVDASRKKFTENLQKKGVSKNEAERIAEKLIGVTWDVGHINMLRKFGWSEKDLIKETEKIAPFVKHVHLSDNFGFEHTELPMGMGNVPLKGILQEIEKKAGKEKIRKVVEAGDWFQHFAEKGGGHPLKPSLQAFDSPLYSMYAGPSWGQLGGFGNYYMGHGAINPPIHHSIYGAGLTTLPVELGGEMPGLEKGRFAQS